MKSMTSCRRIVAAAAFLMLAAALALPASAAKKNKKADNTFWLGADISWETQMEQRGEQFFAAGSDKPVECTQLMKDLGLNAVRLRVWVDPEAWEKNQPRFGQFGGAAAAFRHEGSCDKEDLLEKARRAKDLGMEIMVDFHYSDNWADPGKQPIPYAWRGHSYEQMKEDLKAHTVEVLQLLKDNGIAPRWVQVGNETSNGLLWLKGSSRNQQGPASTDDDMGRADSQPEHYAGFLDAGHEAVKSVFPDAITIVHLDNGWKQSLYDWNLGILEKYGTKYDMVGMSLYPYWARSSGQTDADKVISDCIANIKHVFERFGKESMIVETGFEVNMEQPEIMTEGKRQLARIIEESVNNTDGHCHGVFYWEPECRPRQYKLGAFDADGRPTAIMEAYTEAAAAAAPKGKRK